MQTRGADFATCPTSDSLRTTIPPRLFTFVVFTLFCPALGCKQSAASKVRLVAAERPADGAGFVALWVCYPDREQPIVVRRHHAFLIDWDEQPNLRRFYVYDSPQRRVQITTDFDAFLGCVKQLPAGSKVAWLHTCGASLAFGMAEEDCDQLDAVMKIDGKSLVPLDDETGVSNGLIICTCESIGLRFPGE